MSAESSPPPTGFMVVHGNDPGQLRSLMVAVLRRHPLAPLENEVVLVQSNGVAQWLKLSFAAPPAQGGFGIAAALRTVLPSQFTWEAYRAVLGRDAVPPQSPFDKAQLTWRLIRLLPSLLDRPAFAPLARFLQGDEDKRKLHQLAERVADLFDQYQVYRAEWIAVWAAGRDVLAAAGGPARPIDAEQAWQPQLWRALLADVGPARNGSSRAEVHRRFVEAVEGWQGPPPAGLPRRISVFGISSLPQQVLQVLAALGRFAQVLLCVHNPSRHDWSHIVSGQDLLRVQRRRQQRRPGLRAEAAVGDLHLDAHPLLAAWGKQGRDYVRLLDQHDEVESYRHRFEGLGRIDLFDERGGATLLQQLQDDILDLRPAAETRGHWPAVDPQDDSIAFHVAHGPQREVEILHDALLAAFARDATLRPRDVVVMVPDVATYAPHVRAVFGRIDRKDPRHIPFAIADQAQRQVDPLLGAVEKLLGLPQSRIAVSDVQDLLDVPAVRRRFGIGEEQLPLVNRWIAQARIRWGLHAQHRASLGLTAGELEQNTWAFGLDRMLLGYAVGAGDTWQGTAPLDEIGGLDAALLGPLVRLGEALERHWRALAEAATPADWGLRLRALLQDFFRADDGTEEGLTLLRLETALQEWEETCADAALVQPLPLAVVREHWLQRMEQGGLNQPFFGGGVTIASLMPMRAIPFRWIALLGMNDGDYPRSRMPMDFDLMTKDWWPGDRSRREDDRYLFLEALLSARDHLHVSWVGRSIRDNEELPPSVLVAQLRDHLQAGWVLQGHEGGLLAHLTTVHRLQPFHPAYFDDSPGLPKSYAREWRGTLAGAKAPREPAPLPPLQRETPLTLRVLSDFLKNPVRAFFHERLSVRFQADDAVPEDQEPFAIDTLQNWKLQDELIQAQRPFYADDAARRAALDAQLARIAARGDLPLGRFALGARDELAKPMEDLFLQYGRRMQAWPLAAGPEPVAWTDGELRLEDWLENVRTDASGTQRARIVLESSSITDEKSGWRHDKLLAHWIAHLAGHLGGAPLTTIVVSKRGVAQLQPLALDVAQAHWNALVAAWREGMRRPLPLPVKTALAWLRCEAEDPQRARRDACARYEEHEPEQKKFGEREEDPYLARVFRDFAAVWGPGEDGGEFAALARTLLRPLMAAVGKKAHGEGA